MIRYDAISIPTMQPHPHNLHASSLRCITCGYDLTGATIGSACPECGTPIEQSLRRRVEPLSSGTATTCMVMGILSIAVCALLGPVAIMLYFSAKSQMANGGYSEGSHTMAKAGLILGIIGTSIMCLSIGLISLMGLRF